MVRLKLTSTTATTPVAVIGVGILLCFTLLTVHRSEGGLYSKNDLQQTTNKTTSSQNEGKTASTAGPSLRLECY
jgi:hypothetical protein